MRGIESGKVVEQRMHTGELCTSSNQGKNYYTSTGSSAPSPVHLWQLVVGYRYSTRYGYTYTVCYATVPYTVVVVVACGFCALRAVHRLDLDIQRRPFALCARLATYCKL
jgi:hypothetical protein